jgi:hypothetical protein
VGLFFDFLAHPWKKERVIKKMENQEKKFEEVANFIKGNCHYIIKQPIEDSKPEELELFHKALGNLLYKNVQNP